VRIHHLNCGSMREIDPGDGALEPARALNHCLLVESDAGLVLVETGFGLADVQRAEQSLGRTFLDRTAPVLDPEETALRRVERLGFAAADVRHVVLTHLDLDHSGGLPDFPHAFVHVHEDERRSATGAGAHPEHDRRYRPAHWAHRPRWVTYPAQRGRSWFGFDAIELAGLPDVLLVPLAGHTAGHCGVAVRGEDRWLLHAGDAYYHQGEVDPVQRRSIAPLAALAELTEVDRPLRIGNLARLRELVREHGDEVEVFCAHDPWAFRRLAEPLPAGR
jgi:glyoxylase-like metal-dependent hydrolase (beta-lactamase superfamily II)